MKSLTSTSFLFLIALTSGCATHPTPPTSSAQNWTQAYPGPEADVLNSIPGPPLTGSIEEKSDWDTLKTFQKTRSPEDCKRAASEVVPIFPNLFGPPYGPLSKKETKHLTALFEKLGKMTYHPDFIGTEKKHWNRLRPFVMHSDIEPCIKREPSNSYPSGHAAIARIDARILAELYPKRSDTFFKRADEIAQDRVIAGVHNPSDIRDGKILGDKNYEYLKNTPEYQKLISGFLAH